ncbi:MAG: carboxypeptidase regulatory-like domain-containing protein [Vicinamibacterales bacterium]
MAGLLVASTATAQSNAGITGVARDATGGVLPGVTVEASSPALIEKVRTAVTDDQGRFNIVDLRPGIYKVTFTLAGFSTYVREGIELNAGFTATANAEMKVGGLEETVTVTGASPVVDLTNVRTQQVLRAEVLVSLPSGQRDLTQLASLTLGAVAMGAGRNDVGGDKSETNTAIAVHGGRGDDGRINYDGMNTNVFYGNGGGQQRIWKFNTIGVQETVVDTGGANAETETGGANVNMIPRDGGNKFSSNSIFNYTNTDLASGKVSDDLIARGSAADQNAMKRVYDYGIGVGGPVATDKLWFYSANRWWGSESYAANNYFNKSTSPFRYEPDLARRAYTAQWQRDFGGRLTWQAAEKHKITGSLNLQKACGCWLAISAGSPAAPEAVQSYQYGGDGWMNLTQVSWTYTATNKLLFQVGSSFLNQKVGFSSVADDSWTPLTPAERQVSILEQTTGYRWGTLPGGVTSDFNDPQANNNYGQRYSMAYVTGAHAFKVGAQTLQGVYDTNGNAEPNGLNYTFRAGVPIAVTQFAGPFGNRANLRGFGTFAQDQWRIDRLTLNIGARYDYFHAYTREFTLPAGPFVGERSFQSVKSLPKFNDVTARVGAAYDLFGNGKTAIKGSWGRYLMGQGGGLMNTVAPANAYVTSATRTWNDVNGNFAPDCTFTNLAANGECGPSSEALFGQPRVALTWAESARTGWGTREFNYQYSVALQHELRNGIGLTLGYFRTDWKNITATVNTATASSDYTPFCVTSPTDTRLGDFSARQVCGLYDVNPNKFGQRADVLMLAKDVPGATAEPKEIFNGFDIAINGRFGDGGFFNGGVTLGRTRFNSCWQNDLPQAQQTGVSGNQPRTEEYCNVASPLWSASGSQIKAQVVYPVGFGFNLAGTFKHLPGIPITATLPYTNAQVAANLGRNLAACGAAVTCNATTSVALLPTASSQGNLGAALFDDRLTQVDMRLSRFFRIAGARVQGIAEIYNLTNGRPSQANFATYGAAWLRPTSILGGRLFKFGAQVDF